MRLEDLYELLMDGDNGITVTVTDEQNLDIRGPEDFINSLPQEEFVKSVEKVISMALEMGMFLPEEVFSKVESFLEEDNFKQKGDK